MRRGAAPDPAARARLSLKLACAHLKDACRQLARILAHPRLGDTTWRVRLRAGTAYWWRARVHLHRVAARGARRLRGAAARCKDQRTGVGPL